MTCGMTLTGTTTTTAASVAARAARAPLSSRRPDGIQKPLTAGALATEGGAACTRDGDHDCGAVTCGMTLTGTTTTTAASVAARAARAPLFSQRPDGIQKPLTAGAFATEGGEACARAVCCGLAV